MTKRRSCFVFLLLLWSSLTQCFAATRTIIDMVGRRVEVPAQIRSVLAMSPVGTVFVYTLRPELLKGWNYQPDPGEMALIAPQYRNLPVLGGWFGKDNTGNLERIMQAHPDVLLSMGDPLATAQAERVQAQTHIPVIILDARIEHLPDAYIKAGEIFGNAARAAMLATECRKALDLVQRKIAAIAPEKRRRYYYAEGPKGLETEPGGSMHSEALNFAGGVNVAAGVTAQQGYGHSPVSMEQILRWNPEVIISGYDHAASPGEFYQTVFTDPVWRTLPAVRNRQVYETPQYPFCWIDRPPSVNRIIGILWLAKLFYPDRFAYDLRGETRRFYKIFYQVDLSDAQLNALVATAVRK
jgi:iron complex transport system substrate-binding protein